MSNEQLNEQQMAELEKFRAADAKRKQDYQKWGERYRAKMMLFKIKAEKAGINVTDAEVDAEVARMQKRK